MKRVFVLGVCVGIAAVFVAEVLVTSYEELTGDTVMPPQPRLWGN